MTILELEKLLKALPKNSKNRNIRVILKTEDKEEICRTPMCIRVDYLIEETAKNKAVNCDILLDCTGDY